MASEVERIANLGNRFRGRLGDVYIDAALDYIDHNESSLAYETLGDYLVEFDIAITKEEFDEIRSLSELLILDDKNRNMAYLAKLVTNEDASRQNESM